VSVCLPISRTQLRTRESSRSPDIEPMEREESLTLTFRVVGMHIGTLIDHEEVNLHVGKLRAEGKQKKEERSPDTWFE